MAESRKTEHPVQNDRLRNDCFVSQRAFTLLEIMIAVMVLATSLVTLLSLETSALDRALRDRNRQQAMLLARRIMAQYEAGQVDAEIGTISDTADNLLDDIPRGEQEETEEGGLTLSDFKVDIGIEDWALPELEEESIKRIGLAITWGESLRNRIELVYFIPHQEYDDFEDSDDEELEE